MDEYRVHTKRYKEHLTNIRESDSNETMTLSSITTRNNLEIFIVHSCRDREAQDLGSWCHISSRRVKKQIILTLESKEIQFYPKHLNKEQISMHRRKRIKAGTGSVKHAERAHDLPRLPQPCWKYRGNAPVRLHLMSRFWIEKGGRKRQKGMCLFLAQSSF